jgi:hypothetical protein
MAPSPRLRNQTSFNNLMGQAMEYYYARAFIVSEHVVEMANSPGAFSEPNPGRLDAIC